MSDENQEYNDKYVSVWGFMSPFTEKFDEKNPLTSFNRYIVWNSLLHLEGDKAENQTLNTDGTISAKEFERVIQRHFLLTEEQIRAGVDTKEKNSSEYYDEKTNSYYFLGGYGGGSLTSVVTDSVKDGDMLTLSIDWYGMESEYLNSQELTIRLGNTDIDFVYISGTEPAPKNK